MQKVRVGIIGAGGITLYGHLPALSQMNQVEVVAIADLNRERAAQLAKEYQIPQVYVRPQSIFKNPEIDAVIIEVPNAYHAPLTLQALEQGKHVCCEKPPAMNAKEAEKMAATARRKKKALVYAFNQRYTDRSTELKRRIGKNELGELYYIHASWIRRRFIPGLGGWFTTKRLSGGGPLIDIGVHILDLALWFCGYPKVQSVSGAVFHDLGRQIARTDLGPKGPAKMQVEDLAVAYIRLKNGGVIFLESSFALHTRAKERIDLNLCGTRGGAQWHFPLGGDETPPLVLMGEEKGRPYDLIPQITEGQPWQSYQSELEFFLKCIEEPSLSQPQADWGTTLMKVLDAIYESAKKGREVVL